ncbi:DUF1049 domain-containing protein [Bradyrhizobium manausense]|uniref:lipopolysaccharide assembly protein LapA domain-containing protein n=1 Tax=Bradyrhizobium TaxID=374 RepID=UPI001BA9DCA4|nr:MULTISPECIES: lipopolysaccharide assembly protein LapA domain-containing protein [Bradyrhizobium]MBR0824773.1 DUF1049 domain-containing protein [Bradyrhizobium manausense]UVO29448.1 DUF1049 domain-containing protein [Bradyrhizobium arachidis]
MRKFLTALIVIPLGLLLVVFAVANHHFVTVSFDPFMANDPVLSITLPLFLLLILVAALGVLAGGCAVWFGQRRWRRAARQHEADARSVRTELAGLRASAAAARLDQRQDHSYQPQRLPAPSGAGLYGPVGRDKQRATL